MVAAISFDVSDVVSFRASNSLRWHGFYVVDEVHGENHTSAIMEGVANLAQMFLCRMEALLRIIRQNIMTSGHSICIHV